jgi:ABC-type glycerol-3-phosphate transport system substrate-binding protein
MQTRLRIALCWLLVVLMAVSGCARLAPVPTLAPVTLRLAYREHTVNLQPLVDAFHEKYPHITVQLVKMQRWGSDLGTLLRGKQVDLFIEGRDALDFAKQGYLLPLTEVALDAWDAIRSDYYKGAWESLSSQGQQWGIPAGLDMYAVYINMDVLRSLKLEVPSANWTIEEFTELINRMNYPDGLPGSAQKVYGFCSDPMSMEPLAFVYMHGGRIVDDFLNPTKATLDDPLTIEATRWYASLFGRYAVAPDPEVVRQTFRQGGYMEAQIRGFCGVWVGLYSNRGGMDTPYPWTISWKMLPFPRDKARLNAGEVDGYYIAKDSPHPEEALKLIRFLADRWEASGTKLPPRRSLVESAAYAQAVGPDVAKIAAQFPNEVIILPTQLNPKLEQVGVTYFQTLERIIREGLDPQDALEEAQQKVQKLF